jgi:hypothetical protein
MAFPIVDEHSFGRVENPPDARDYKMSAVLSALPPMTVPTYKVWMPPDNVLYQGNLGACVGFTGAAWLECEPVVQQVTSDTGRYLYYECKKIDGYSGEGTYSRALMKIITGHGAVGSYHFADNMADLDLWLLTQGPVMIGIPWYQGMMYPDAAGNVSISGSIVGGHEILVYGKLSDGRYILRNSWGAGWGMQGDCCLTRDQLERLIWNDPAWRGDACAAYQVGAIFNPGDAMSTPTPFLECFPWPDGSIISGEFGNMSQGYPHRGMDAQLPVGTPLVPGATGTVVPFLNSLTEWPLGSGNMVPAFGIGVCIKYDSGTYGLLAHNSQVLVGIGERVVARQVIAKSGNSGVSTGPHCHFQCCVNSDFPLDIRASYDPRLLLMEDEMSAEALARLDRLEKIVAANAVKGTPYPGTEECFPAGTPTVPEGTINPPVYVLTGESALRYCELRGFSFALGLRNTQVAQRIHVDAGDSWHHTGG